MGEKSRETEVQGKVTEKQGKGQTEQRGETGNTTHRGPGRVVVRFHVEPPPELLAIPSVLDHLKSLACVHKL